MSSIIKEKTIINAKYHEIFPNKPIIIAES